MICFDSNIIIYIGNGTLDENIVSSEPICYADVSIIETLGYTEILASEEQRIREFLATMTQIPLSESIIQTAVKLRQLKKMSLGDSVVAATAIEQGGNLWTANTKDFVGIEGLKIFNPLN
jgi:predicted nucleic acid-binding protein